MIDAPDSPPHPTEPDDRLDTDHEEVPVDDEENEVVPYRYSITAYGADYPVDSLVKRLDAGDIVIPTFDPEVTTSTVTEGFQRGFVWTKPQADKFVESLLLGLPVPGIFLVKEPDENTLFSMGSNASAHWMPITRASCVGANTSSLMSKPSFITWATKIWRSRTEAA